MRDISSQGSGLIIKERAYSAERTAESHKSNENNRSDEALQDVKDKLKRKLSFKKKEAETGTKE